MPDERRDAESPLPKESTNIPQIIAGKVTALENADFLVLPDVERVVHVKSPGD